MWYFWHQIFPFAKQISSVSFQGMRSLSILLMTLAQVVLVSPGLGHIYRVRTKSVAADRLSQTTVEAEHYCHLHLTDHRDKCELLLTWLN